MPGATRDIEECRRAIDEIDSAVVKLLNERAKHANSIGQLKKLLSLAVHQPEREAIVLEHVRSANDGPLSDDSILRIFSQIIEESRHLEKKTSTDE